MHHLSKWKNVPPIATQGLIVNPPFNVILSNKKLDHVENLKNESKCALIGDYLKPPPISSTC